MCVCFVLEMRLRICTDGYVGNWATILWGKGGGVV